LRFLVVVEGDGQLGLGADGRRDGGADDPTDRVQAAATAAATTAAVQRRHRGPAATLRRVLLDLDRCKVHAMTSDGPRPHGRILLGGMARDFKGDATHRPRRDGPRSRNASGEESCLFALSNLSYSDS